MAKYIKCPLEKFKLVETPEFFNNLDANFGDIVSFTDDYKYIVGKNKIIKLEDRTIPLKITKQFDNAYEHYKDIIRKYGICIELKNSDGFFWINYGEAFPKEWSITIIPGKDRIYYYHYYLNIDFGNGKSKNFTQKEYLSTMKTVSSRNEPDSVEPFYEIEVSCLVEGKSLVKRWKKYRNKTMIAMPETWKEHCHDIHLENNDNQETFVYSGPESSKKTAVDAIIDYYEDFDGEIKLNISEPKIKN